MDQFRVEVVLRHHWCWQFLGGKRHPFLCCLVLALTFTADFQALRSFVRFVIGRTRWQSFGRYSLRYTKGKSEGRRFCNRQLPGLDVDCRFSLTELGRISWRAPTVYLFPLGILPSFLYAVSDSPKSALLTDVLAVSFAFNAITLVQLDSFLTGSVVLGGLFVYDIWWVFGTEVVSASAHVHMCPQGAADVSLRLDLQRWSKWQQNLMHQLNCFGPNLCGRIGDSPCSD